jgi:hypothetical protein
MSATSAPEIEDASPQGPRLALPSRRNPAGAGWEWIASGWRLFMRAPLMWIISVVILFLFAAILHIIPGIGSVIVQLLQGVIFGGFMVACHSLARGGDFELDHLLAGFRTHFKNLFLLGVFLALGGLAIMLVLAMFVGVTVLTAIMSGSAEMAATTLMASAFSMLLGGLVALALTVPLLAAFWFAPALVVLNNLTPVAALRESFVGSFRNFVPFLVYGVVMLVFAILAAIPFMLGFFVWIPVAIASTYTAYRGIFTEGLEEPAVVV